MRTGSFNTSVFCNLQKTLKTYPKESASKLSNFTSNFTSNLEYVSTTRSFNTPIIEGITQNKSFDFSCFYNEFTKVYPDKNKPSSLFLEWLIGFSEGEGSFCLAKKLIYLL